MKTKIKVKAITDNIFPVIIDKGDWIDLYTGEDTEFTATNVKFKVIKYISLGIAVQLPKGFEAIIAPRSSTAKNFSIINPGSIGIIDNSYCGNNDIWKFPAMAFKTITIPKLSRIAQFRIQLSQKATLWQKIKWFLSSGIEIVEVNNLSDNNRGGFGSTGVK